MTTSIETACCDECSAEARKDRFLAVVKERCVLVTHNDGCRCMTLCKRHFRRWTDKVIADLEEAK